MDIILLGFSNSGKSTAALYLNKIYKYKIYEISKFVMREFEQQKEFSTPIDFCNYYYNNQQLTFFVKKMIEVVNPKENNKVFVGPRSKEEIDIIKNLSPDAKIVGIISNFDVRYNRFQITKKIKGKNKTLHERDIIEKSWGLTYNLIEQSDYLIVNNGNMEKFYQSIDEIIKIQEV